VTEAETFLEQVWITCDWWFLSFCLPAILDPNDASSQILHIKMCKRWRQILASSSVTDHLHTGVYSLPSTVHTTSLSAGFLKS